MNKYVNAFARTKNKYSKDNSTSISPMLSFFLNVNILFKPIISNISLFEPK